MLTAVTTGLRVAELIALRIGDVTTSPTGHIRVLGKRRKNRTTPLKAETATVLSDWLHERQGDPNDPVFPTRQGRALSQDAITKLLAKHTSSNTSLPVTRRQTRHPAHPQTHQRDAPPSPARRHRDDRALARPREHQDHLHLPARQPGLQTRSDRPDRHDRHPTRPIPTPDTLLAFLDSLTIIPTSQPPRPAQKQGRQRRQPPESG